MRIRTGERVAEAIADEIQRHRGVADPLHLALPPGAEDDRRALVSELWSDLVRSGSLWSNIRLIRDGRDLHPSEFMRGRIGDGLIVHSYVDVRNAIAHLRQGATLIHNHLHETSYPVQRLQESLEYQIEARVWVQAYLTTASTTAFGLHRDDHNFVALQLLGAKEWRIGDAEADADAIRLTAGQGLFLRSGTPHAVSGTGELSLHLTVAFDWLPTAIDQPGSKLSDEEFESHARLNRLGSGLPLALDESLVNAGLGVRMAGRVKPRLEEAEENLLLTCAAGRFILDRRLSATLDCLLSGKELSLDELVHASSLNRQKVEAFVTFAASRGILFVGP